MKNVYNFEQFPDHCILRTGRRGGRLSKSYNSMNYNNVTIIVKKIIFSNNLSFFDLNNTSKSYLTQTYLKRH